MKKIVVILLLIVYSSATMGATIHFHYCMNKLIGWSLWHGKKANACGKCGMKEKKSGCCKDEHKQIKLKAEHQKSVPQYKQFLDSPVLLDSNTDLILTKSTQLFTSPIANGSPLVLNERLYILHCILLI